ncbi:MAG: phosphate acyltransferase PlsX [Bacteroidia bacterium]|nr:phosphate acyltransferase PlsX [Bacteroidia bacterium]MCF8427193.1 phosphate acyltransferase PlsX [Bacteroidia bacterium]MCF8445418.1 phosphate acyltransferase PlsX [Bacteroidia bacterium]
MKIGFDIMGGDFAPKEAIQGAVVAQRELGSKGRIVLIGDKEQALHHLANEGANADDFDFVHTTEIIGMSEHPTKAISQKKDSSIAVGFGLLAHKKINSFVSAGNTGAMLVGSMFSVKPIEGVIRPCVTAMVPKAKGGVGLILDVGANADCKPDVLYQFGVLGSLLLKHVYNNPDPKVGLLSIGEEKEKGNLVTISAHNLMEQTTQFNFIGNVEGRDIISDKVDVIVCDGFTGNVVLKALESMYFALRKRGIHDEYLESFNYENFGGTPILGVNAPVIIGHGVSNAKAFKNMILSAHDVVKSNLVKIIHDEFQNIVPPSQ